MAEVQVAIGGREFEVACRDGEEHYLKSAAAMLDAEAGALNEALGRMPETRMLLMAGLMLADKTASLEDRLKHSPGGDPAAGKRARKTEAQLSKTQAALAEAKAELAEAQAGLTKADDARKAAVEAMKRMVVKIEDAASGMKKAG